MYMYMHVRIATLKSAQNIINVQDILNNSTHVHIIGYATICLDLSSFTKTLN